MKGGDNVARTQLVVGGASFMVAIARWFRVAHVEVTFHAFCSCTCDGLD